MTMHLQIICGFWQRDIGENREAGMLNLMSRLANKSTTIAMIYSEDVGLG
ncbi:hypothetical protein [Pseudaquidulcibacter saccharophilus]|nr:hypothetical protein [Pseudaquidulcibacter saccharophilus]